MLKSLYLELSRKEILDGVDKNFIHHGEYTADLRQKIGALSVTGHNWYLADYSGSILRFKIKSATDKSKEYVNVVSFKEFFDYLRNSFKFGDYDIKQTEDQAELIKDLKDLIRNAVDTDDVLVNCDCPSYKYYYRYVATQLDYQTKRNKENRPAKIRNPQDRGTLCKHLAVTMNALAEEKIREHLIEIMLNEFLSVESKRRYGEYKKLWWLDHFKYI